MKVLQVLPELNEGGVERGTLEIGRFLAQEGHHALVVSNGGRLVPSLEAAGVRHIQMPVHRKSLSGLFLIRPLRRLLSQEKPDILHLRSRWPAWLAWLAWRGLPRGMRPRLVTTVHGFYSVNPYSAIMTRGERVIAVSQSIQAYILENYPRTNPARIRIIPRGVDPTEFPRGYQPDTAWLVQWYSDLPMLQGARLLTMVGRITRGKGHEDFLRVLQALRDTEPRAIGLVVGGVAPGKERYQDELQQRLRQWKLQDRVVFLGYRPDVREILAISDVVFSLSRTPESFGRTSLEALALGRPVVGYDHGGVGEQLRALLPAGAVPPGDIQAAVAVTKKFLQAPPNPAVIGPPFTLEAMCRSTLDVYQELGRPNHYG
ncbi:MAG: glycosyltransferase family 4 protein [Verrucomicrobiota bacterium]|nr:glycosyltransferase family 4 protein [Limisphaera sp.]MDW8382997.1 glycosyltransferase family 4 protein [Verrucomicrobiota bacterium]